MKREGKMMNEHGGNVYVDGQLKHWQDMSANINALGLPHSVRTAILNSLDNIVHYPDVNSLALKKSISKRYNIATENILTLNGATEFFYLYFKEYKPNNVLIVSPTFSEYERAARAAGCNVRHFITSHIDGFKINMERLISELTGDECVVICRPNNPTGTMTDIEQLLKISAISNLIVDESFIDFVKCAKSANEFVYEKLMVVHSLTKIYAIPGLRLGFAAAPKSMIERLDKVKDVWNVNSLAQAAGVSALDDVEYINQTHEWLKSEIEYVTRRLQDMNIMFYEPTANFILMYFKNATEIIEKLKQNNILVRSCANFIGLNENYIRMAIRTRSENERALDLIGGLMRR